MRSASRLWGLLASVIVASGLVLGGCGESKGGAPAESPAAASTFGGYPSGAATQSAPSDIVAPHVAGTSAQPAQPSPPPPPAAAPDSPSSSPSIKSESSKKTATADAAPAPRPETRPGLGTEFGESRVSRVHDVSFVRDSSRPFAIAAMNYNDRRGVDALVASAKQHDTARSVSAASGAVTISIRDASGNPLEATHVGDKTFVVGQAGQRYSIVLENHTGHRFEAVGTVDGLDIINGKAGTFDNRGYVLLPFATLTIDGFRTSTSSVAAFRFAAVSDSYAAQTGSARNVGVIGIAFFNEKGDAFVPENETRLRETASPFPADPRFAQPPPGR